MVKEDSNVPQKKSISQSNFGFVERPVSFSYLDVVLRDETYIATGVLSFYPAAAHILEKKHRRRF